VTALLADIASHTDGLLRIAEIPDYPNAVNGVQFAHRGPVRAIASAVDASERTIRAAAAAGANLLIVHHGLFWGGVQPLVGFRHERVRLLMEHDIAVYSAHLPLDVHETMGNSRLLADHLSLPVSGGFAHFQGVACGVRGVADVDTGELARQVALFASGHGGHAVATARSDSRRTLHWAICSGAGAGTDTLAEATALGIDTLIVGEGPHWTAVDAPERGLVIMYAGHYATETLGVRALGDQLAATFGLPHTFVAAPTGL
jgi:dinuclear metal center YbgI/SA1388 family protein